MSHRCKFCGAVGEHKPSVFMDQRRISGQSHDLSIEVTCHSFQCGSCGTTDTDMPELPENIFSADVLEDRDFVVTGIHKAACLEEDDYGP